MAVEVRLPTVLRNYAGGASVVSLDGATIGEVLGKLVAEYPGMSGQVGQENGVPISCREEQLFLDFRGQMQQIHNLANPCPRDVPQLCHFPKVGDVASPQPLVQA